MTDLNELRSDVRAIHDGIWMPVPAYGFEIQVRGFTDEFHDARTLRTEKAAEPYGGNEKRIPNAIQRTLNASLMEDFLIIGVRGLQDKGTDVTLEAFHQMLYQEEFSRMSRVCWETAGIVSARSVAQVEAAAKNSDKPSATS